MKNKYAMCTRWTKIVPEVQFTSNYKSTNEDENRQHLCRI